MKNSHQHLAFGQRQSNTKSKGKSTKVDEMDKMDGMDRVGNCFRPRINAKERELKKRNEEKQSRIKSTGSRPLFTFGQRVFEIVRVFSVDDVDGHFA